jgi:uncharacterized protein (TIGR00730 family)
MTTDPRTELLGRITSDAASILHPSELTLCARVVGDLAAAINTLAPFDDRPKITIFGSARLRHTDPSYNQIRELAASLAEDGYVVVTGGGPGIMTAGLEGAGSGNAVGVSIRLPFETPAFHLDIPVIRQEHFPTRKLSMIRHVRGFVAAPGGIGTLDEIAEVLTLLQTGHKQPTPVILLDDGAGIWNGFETLMDHMAERALVDSSDRALYRIVNTWQEAHQEIQRFWSRYRGCHGAAGALVLRLASPVSSEEAEELQKQYPDLAPLPHQEGLLCGFDGKSYGRLRMLIDTINDTARTAGTRNGHAPVDDGNMAVQPS